MASPDDETREYKILKWQNIHDYVDVIANSLKMENKFPKVIVAILRGGLFPGVLLLKHFPEAKLITLSASSWTEGTQHELQIGDIPEEVTALPREEVIFIDDVCDTGTTLEAVVSSGMVAALVTKWDVTSLRPDFSGSSVKDNPWIIFPWETLDLWQASETLVP